MVSMLLLYGIQFKERDIVMPINSFENYLLTWKPDKQKLCRPYYKSLSKLLIDDILNGVLKPNTMLPPQRELADFLDLNLSTITKAYNICRLYGFVYGQIGKGTFVSVNKATNDGLFVKNERLFELALIEPFYEFDTLTHEVAKDVINQKSAVELLRYSEPFGSKYQLKMAKKYLSKLYLDVNIEQIAIFQGAQNSIAIILLSLFKMGDIIAVDTYTYSSFRKLANTMGIQLISVESDEDGMLPSLLDTACLRFDIKGIFLMPTCSNPTNTIMSLKRRNELSNIIVRKNLLLIEDETYAFILEQTIPPFASIIPQNTVYINGLSKALSAGLRIAFVCFPVELKDKILDTAINVNLNNVSINAEIASKMIERGIAEQMIKKKREQCFLRNAIYKSIFIRANKSQGFFQWLELPIHYKCEEFELYAKKRGIKVLGSHHFLVGKQTDKNYIRIALSSISCMKEYSQALQLLNSLLNENYL